MADLKRYEAARGSRSLREAISRYCRTFFGLAVDAEREILVTHGGAGALTAAILAVSNPGDEVLVGDPSYMLYERLLTVVGRMPRRIPRPSSGGYRYDLDCIQSLIGPTTSAMILNSPENPTGYVCPNHELRQIASLCARNGVMLIHDEVYDQLNFSGDHAPAALLAGFDNVVQVNSMSKKCGVPGLRIGWLLSNAAVVDAAAKAQDYTILAVNAFSERVAEALLDCADLGAWFAATRATIERRIALVRSRLSTLPGVEFPSEVGGGMFSFPTVSDLAEHLRLPPDRAAGDVVSDWLLREAGVALVPGGVYGREGRQSVRLVVCGDEGDLVEALRRIEERVHVAQRI